MATRYIMTHEVIRREEARLLRIFEAYPVNGRKTNTGTIKMIREEIGNMTFRIARKCNVSVNYPRWSIQGKKVVLGEPSILLPTLRYVSFEIKDALLARFEERMPEDFILWNFSPLSPHLWYLQALVYVLVIAFIVEHLGLRKLAYLAVPVLLAGNLIKGNYSLLLLGKDYCHVYYARNFLYCGLPFFWLGCLFGERKEALEGCLDKKKMTLLLGGILVFWNMALMEQRWLTKMNALGTEEEYGGTIFLAVCIFLLFIGWQNFYKENVVTRIMAKIGKDYSMLIYVLHYAVLQALSKCFKGRHTMLARGYRQYGMMFVFAATVVLVAAYGAAKRKLRENSTVKVGNAVLERV